MLRRLLPIAFLAAMTVAAFGTIRSYDLFWQLATGRWIVEHRALPLTDPFALASERSEWIDGEWLYEVFLYIAHEVAGMAGLSWLRGLLAAAIFTIAFIAARRESEMPNALLVSAIAFAGAMPVLDLRPSALAALMVVLMLAARPLWLRVLIAIVWMNVHPSALLAPIVGARRDPRAALVLVLALLVNPHGWKGIVAPVELMSFVRGATFVNAEWLPSSPAIYPLLYLALVLAVVAFALEPKRDWWRIALVAMFAFLAVRHVRNQPLFFAAFAMLVRLPPLRPALAYAGSVLAILFVAISGNHRLGVSPERFPIAAVARLESTGYRGNLYNPDQFGGFLIWSFYPERRVLTDGRNELYRAFIPQWQQAREDGRKWSALLRDYRIDLAVEEYRPPLRVTDASTGRVVEMPADLAYWPQSQWALIAIDDAAMVFARRAAFQGVERWEIARPVSSRARSGR